MSNQLDLLFADLLDNRIALDQCDQYLRSDVRAQSTLIEQGFMTLAVLTRIPIVLHERFLSVGHPLTEGFLVMPVHVERFNVLCQGDHPGLNPPVALGGGPLGINPESDFLV